MAGLPEEGLQTLEDDGGLPKSRMVNAFEAKSRVDMLIRADGDKRSPKRALVKGLVDGNAPYRHEDLVAAGRADMWNVNFRMAEAYLATALSAVYDIFSQSPTYAAMETYHGKGMEQQDWSAIITEEFDRLLKTDRFLDYEMQNSQYDMVLYGCGPMIFRGNLDWRPRFNPCGMLLVPEFAKSKTEEWEECAYRVYYSPHDLYNYIRYPAEAAKAGWAIEDVKQSIMWAHPRTRDGGIYQSWEWHQQALKNSSYHYSAESRSIHVGHYFFREFPIENEELGRITHTMIDLSYDGQGANEWLYRNERRFGTWEEVVHPMYYDHGGGGYHHSVTGMGIKMYSAMAGQNRLLNNLADKAFAPKIMFKPTSAAQDQQLQLARFGDYARIPNGFELQQVSVQGFLDEGLSLNQTLTEIIGGNLSQYRREMQKTSGNPITATQTNFMAQSESTMAQTSITHLYNQLDWLYQEMFKRAANFNLPPNTPGGAAARDFQDRCVKRGVPKEALHKVASVRASRVVGQGSAYLRRDTLGRLLNLLPRLPQSGQDKLIRDYIASEAGYSLVNRYAPERDKGKLADEHEMMATLQVSAARQGTAPVMADGQNHVVYAQIFLTAAAHAAASLKQSGPQGMPAVLGFLETIGPAIHAHLDAIKDDPTRAAVYKALMAQFKKLAMLTDKLHKQMQQQQQKQQQEMAKRQQMMQRAKMAQNGRDPEMQLKAAQAQQDMKLKAAKVRNDIALKSAKARQTLDVKAAQVRQGLAATDLKTAQEIRRKRHSAFSE